MRFYPKEIGKRIAEVRKSNGINQKDFAVIMGVSIAALSLYERGESDPNTKFLCLLSEEFHVSIDWLLTGVESEPEVIKESINELALRKAVDYAIDHSWIKIHKNIKTNDFYDGLIDLYKANNKINID